MTGPSDDHILNGSWHKCICGAQYSDSDGGPCHWKCDTCGDIVDDDHPCSCVLVGIPLGVLRRCERALRFREEVLSKTLLAEIEEMRIFQDNTQKV